MCTSCPRNTVFDPKTEKVVFERLPFVCIDYVQWVLLRLGYYSVKLELTKILLGQSEKIWVVEALTSISQV